MKQEINKYGHIPTLKEIKNIPKNGTVISTFSGVGGSSLGYKLAGFNVLASIEFLDYQAHNYRINHSPETRLIEQDIRKIDPTHLIHSLGLKKGELDILDGSPPCSGFSKMGLVEKGWGIEKIYGNRKQRVDDLFFEYTRFLTAIQPKVFVAENVKGLVIGNSKGYFKMIFKALQDCGYNVKAKVINAKFYGVPQDRERLIFIGFRKDLGLNPIFPTPTPKIIPLEYAFRNLPPHQVPKEAHMDPKNKNFKVWSCTKLGDKFEKYNLKTYGKSAGFSRVRLHPKKESPTLTTSPHLFHWEHPRSLTIPEAKRIVTFPQDFILEGSYRRQYEACGRAVPPLMMKAIATQIRKQIFAQS